MKIKSLTLSGFKSFADRTVVEFNGGITAVVGPNGCGKSNISDALRWVLGEQRASAIRGSRMDEAIFHGTASRKPIHRAEVELRISNADGMLPVPYPEVSIGRTVLRGGESVYELNGQSVRLRDVQDLCRDTGLGANAYSIIESKMIDAILSDRPEERRSLFEEAAEVGRYKDRRRTALRRLEQASSDLQRLEDVIGEVATKVRSLSRQRGRATRYGDLRERRLVLEVSVAAASLDSIERRLGEAERELEGVRKLQPEDEARLATEETEVEALRLHLIEQERERGRVASRLETVRGRLEEIERERLVTDERLGAARRRLDEIGREREGIEGRLAHVEEEKTSAAERVAGRRSELTALSEREAELEARANELRADRQKLEREQADGRTALTALIAEIGRAGAEIEGRKERDRARAAEREHLSAELAKAGSVRGALEAEREATERAAAAAQAAKDTVATTLDEARGALRSSRETTLAIRERLAGAEGELASVSARAAGLASLLAEGKDLPPIVTRLLADRERVGGIEGVLAEFMDVPPDLTRAVEAQLGSFLHGVVVDGWKAVERVKQWLAGRDETDGLILLPLDPGPSAEPTPPRGGIETFGAGAVWARALLAGVEFVDGDLGPAEGRWVARDGSGRDLHGAVRLGQPAGGKGILRRRAELQALELQRGSLEKDAARLRSEAADLEATARELAERTAKLDAEHELRMVELRAAIGAAETAAERSARAERRTAELESRLAEPAGQAIDQGAGGAPEEAVRELEAKRDEQARRIEQVGADFQAATQAWESAREELQEQRIALARAEADHRGEAERMERAEAALADLRERTGRLEEETLRHKAAIEAGTTQLAGSEAELEELFRSRSELEADVRGRIEGLEERRADLEQRESALRAARAREREASEKRHALELELTELWGRSASIRERVEAEWERSLEDLRREVSPPEEGTAEGWAEELIDVRKTLATLGPVNMLAAAEYEEEKERLDFLESQKADLVSARDDLHDSIDRINETASGAFLEVFEQVRANFRDIFVTLFEGGQCDVWLEDPSDPLDSPIEISASPRGKRTQRIHLLSGGERTLTALGLLFAIYLAKPSPFCVMDEVDAPLDESNIGRFTAMLERFARDTQFLVITHNARTIEVADFIYGVTMQEPGVSTLVALDMQNLPKAVAV